MPQGRATKVAAKLRSQQGVDFVHVDREMSVLNDPSAEPVGEDPGPAR